MDIESFRNYCLSKQMTSEHTPFGPDTLVFKVCGKMFALCDFEFESFNVKCSPELAIELREKYDEVQPGYHMNKKHWNTIQANGRLPDQLMRDWIDLSYDLVVKTLTIKQRSLFSE